MAAPPLPLPSPAPQARRLPSPQPVLTDRYIHGAAVFAVAVVFFSRSHGMLWRLWFSSFTYVVTWHLTGLPDRALLGCARGGGGNTVPHARRLFLFLLLLFRLADTGYAADLNSSAHSLTNSTPIKPRGMP